MSIFHIRYHDLATSHRTSFADAMAQCSGLSAQSVADEGTSLDDAFAELEREIA